MTDEKQDYGSMDLAGQETNNCQTRKNEEKEMKVTNTSKFPTNEIRNLIRIAKGNISTKNVVFHIKDSESWAGRVYYSGYNTFGMPLIIVRLTDKLKYPYPRNTTYTKTYYSRPANDFRDDDSYKLEENMKTINCNVRKPKYEVRNWREMMLSILAHELAHLKLYRKSQHHSEVRCEKFALKRLEKYRGE